MATSVLYRVEAPSWAETITVTDGIVARPPTHVPDMLGWHLGRVRSYCVQNGYRLAKVNADGSLSYL
jgi:hypothetical protein